MKNIFNLSLIVLLALSISSCKNKSDAQEAGEAKVVNKSAASGNLPIDGMLSKVLWSGSKPTGTHNGTVNVMGGSVSVSDGKLTGGRATIDMNSITSLDLEGGMKANLEAHLKGTASGKEDDFFNVAQHPTATFEVSKVTGLANNADGNSLVYGNLTMKGVTKSISFPATITVSDNMVSVQSSKFKINRTDWGITFQSKNFIEGLKDKFIDDDVEISLNLVAKG